MVKQPKFILTFAPETIEHFDCIEPKYHALLRRTIKDQLTYTPTEETRNRKPLDQPAPFDASWELRCGPDNRFRVFYDVDAKKNHVKIEAIGHKVGSNLFIRGKEYQL